MPALPPRDHSFHDCVRKAARGRGGRGGHPRHGQPRDRQRAGSGAGGCRGQSVSRLARPHPRRRRLQDPISHAGTRLARDDGIERRLGIKGSVRYGTVPGGQEGQQERDAEKKKYAIFLPRRSAVPSAPSAPGAQRAGPCRALQAGLGAGRGPREHEGWADPWPMTPPTVTVATSLARTGMARRGAAGVAGVVALRGAVRPGPGGGVVVERWCGGPVGPHGCRGP